MCDRIEKSIKKIPEAELDKVLNKDKKNKWF